MTWPITDHIRRAVRDWLDAGKLQGGGAVIGGSGEDDLTATLSRSLKRHLGSAQVVA